MIPLCRAPDSGPPAAPDKFEDLLGRLEKIVNDMEGADLPLEKLLSSYEEGMRLVKACGDRLADAEQKVEILSRGALAAPSAPTAPEASPAATGDTVIAPGAGGEEEIRLI